MFSQPILYAICQLITIIFRFQIIFPIIPTTHGQDYLTTFLLLFVIPTRHLFVKWLDIFFHSLFQKYWNALFR